MLQPLDNHELVLILYIIGTDVLKLNIKDDTMVDKNFRQEACQLYLEQEIDDRLAEGKTPGKIGKELTKEIEKLFEARVKPATIKKRAQRRKGTDVPSKKNTGTDVPIKATDKIVITDEKLIKEICSIAEILHMTAEDVIWYGIGMYKQQ